MKRLAPLVRPLTLAALLGAGWNAPPAWPQAAAAVKAEAPLRGRAWQLANQAYAHYQAGRFARAASAAASAIQLRPDLLRLRMLLIYSLQRQGKNEEALKAIASARAAGMDEATLQQAETNVRAAATGGAAAGGGAATASEAYNKAFPIATEAYADYNARNYADSARKAEQAFRLDPTQGQWALLWIGALEAQDQLGAAIEAADAALSLDPPNKSDLVAKRQTLRRSQAVLPAQKAYQALIANNPAQAVPFAREAVALAPGTASHRLLLITSLMLAEQLPDAEKAADEALAQDNEDTAALGMRGYIRQRQGKTTLANEDFDDVLKQDWLDEKQSANLRLIAADAALAAGDAARARALLAPMPAQDESVARRLKQADGLRPGRDTPMVADTRGASQTLAMADYPPPLQDCRDTPYGTVCELQPSDAQGAGGPSAQAYAAYARQDYKAAIEHAQTAVEQDPDNEQLQKLLTTTLAAGNRDQQGQALLRLDKSLSLTPNDAQLLMQRGYLYSRQEEPAKALQDFRAARATGEAPAGAMLDEGYALAGTGDSRGAVRTFKEAIDLDDAGTAKLTPGQRENARSAVSGYSREWGAIVSLGYRGARPAGRAFSDGILTQAGDAVFGTAEAYWRPSNFLNSSTRIFDVYGRLGSTLHDGGGTTLGQSAIDPCTGLPINVQAGDNRGISGLPTTTGSLGMRFTPSTKYALTFGIERQFNIGSATRSGFITPESPQLRCLMSGRDPLNPTGPALGNPISAKYSAGAGQGGWLAYVTHGFYEGTGRRTDRSSWFTMEGYSQAGYANQSMASRFTLTDQTNGAVVGDGSGRYKREQWFFSTEARIGRSFRADGINQGLVIFPFGVVAADWIKQRNRVQVRSLQAAPGATPTAAQLAAQQGQTLALQGNGSSWSASAGVGISLRQWFRESHYSTAQSYLDWSMQYRFNIGGGQADRAKGLFMTLTLSY
ncbi:tetratricopeptide repeat protein [Delftia tsuruhatensis]|uniref:NfrA family protein n=1 Tax=Delftia tsuruhatensis TaxID=180282 RepID=UPI002448E6BD|nr:tetratricopeptide repeat protein [Delftia tsuruhatensis]MDH0850916.1 tetratricopeptide repeat protein [Delftia tsuruhatensis]